jgi:hypothetical protein
MNRSTTINQDHQGGIQCSAEEGIPLFFGRKVTLPSSRDVHKAYSGELNILPYPMVLQYIQVFSTALTHCPAPLVGLCEVNEGTRGSSKHCSCFEFKEVDSTGLFMLGTGWDLVRSRVLIL